MGFALDLFCVRFWWRVEPRMSDYAVERTVTVWSQPLKVTVYRKTKTIWIAAGDYMGKTIYVKRGTQGAAVKGWADAARDRGNAGPMESSPTGSPGI